MDMIDSVLPVLGALGISGVSAAFSVVSHGCGPRTSLWIEQSGDMQPVFITFCFQHSMEQSQSTIQIWAEASLSHSGLFFISADLAVEYVNMFDYGMFPKALLDVTWCILYEPHSLLYLFVCVHAHVHSSVCFVYMHVCICVWRWRFSLNIWSTLCFKGGSVCFGAHWLGKLAVQWTHEILLSPTSALLCGFRRPKSFPHGCMACTLLNEPSSQPPFPFKAMKTSILKLCGLWIKDYEPVADTVWLEGVQLQSIRKRDGVRKRRWTGF